MASLTMENAEPQDLAPAGEVEERLVERGPIDVFLLVVVAALVGIGILAVYSGSALSAHFTSREADDLFYLRKQVSGAVAGAFAMTVAARLDYDFYRRHVYPLLVGSFLLLCLTLVPGMATTVNGATRWISVAGVRFQPAELVKVVAAMFLAYSVSKKGDRMRFVAEAFVAHGVIFLPFACVLLSQPDLGSTTILFGLMAVMLFVGGTRLSYMFGLAGAGAVLLWAAIQAASYRLDRITAWLDPWADASDTGYQLVNSYIALANGGWTGTGFGEGRGRLGYVPELYNDFVGAAVGEQFGLVGLAALAILYVLFLWRGTVIAFRARDAFGAYLAFGITTLIGMQACINLCVVTGILPTKGLTLPFVSYGRSSLVILLYAVGILLNISQRNPNLHPEWVAEKERAIMENSLREKELRLRKRIRSLGGAAGTV